MRLLKSKLSELVADRQLRSLRTMGEQCGVPRTTWFRYLDGGSGLLAGDRKRVAAAIAALGIGEPLDELEREASGDQAAYANEIIRPGQQVMLPAAFDPIKTCTGERRRFMLSVAVRQRYGFNRDPFSQDVGAFSEVFFGPAHRAAFDAMLDAAKYSGFAALIAEVGFGKTILRKAIGDTLKAKAGSPYVVCNVEQLTRERLTTSRILDELITDITGVRPMSLDETTRTRKVRTLLETFHQQGKQVVLTIDEAHVLPHQTLRGLKRLYEIESGLVKHLSILLFGQLQLWQRLRSPDLEEVTSRVQIVMTYGLRTVASGKIEDGIPERKVIGKRAVVCEYIRKRLEWAGVRDWTRIIEPKAVDAIADAGDVPLRIHTLATSAFNVAFEAEHDCVTVEDVDHCRPEARPGSKKEE